MNDFRKNLNLGDLDMNELNDEFSIFSDRILEDINPQMTFPNSGDERYFCKETNKMLNQKRKKRMKIRIKDHIQNIHMII